MSQTDRSSQSAAESKGDKPSLLERLRGLFGLGQASIRDDIEDALEDNSTATEFSAHERVLLRNVLDLHDLRVQDVMVPRADIISIGIDTQLIDVLNVFRTAGHSRLPVYAETLDDPRGMIHIRDFVDYLAAMAEASGLRRATRRAAASAASANDPEPTTSPPALSRLAGSAGIDLSQPLTEARIIRPVLYAPPSMRALDLLVRMQATRTHMALVIDEYGGTDGLVSIEDIVEMIVGDIEDEHDIDESPQIDKLADGSFVADARAELEEATRLIGVDLATLAESDEVLTLGGLVTTLAGRVPVRGEVIRTPGPVEFEILDADPRRVKRIRITLHQAGETPVTAPESQPAGSPNQSPDDSAKA